VVDDDMMNRMIMSTKLTQVLYYALTYYAHSHTMRTHILCALTYYAHSYCTWHVPYSSHHIILTLHAYCTHTARILHAYCTHTTQAQCVHILCAYHIYTIYAYRIRTLTHNWNAPHSRAPLLRFIPVC
jgi:hypothetical protein